MLLAQRSAKTKIFECLGKINGCTLSLIKFNLINEVLKGGVAMDIKMYCFLLPILKVPKLISTVYRATRWP